MREEGLGAQGADMLLLGLHLWAGRGGTVRGQRVNQAAGHPFPLHCLHPLTLPLLNPYPLTLPHPPAHFPISPCFTHRFSLPLLHLN